MSWTEGLRQHWWSVKQASFDGAFACEGYQSYISARLSNHHRIIIINKERRVCRWTHASVCVCSLKCHHSSCPKTQQSINTFRITKECVLVFTHSRVFVYVSVCVCVCVCVCSSEVCQTVLPSCWQAIAMQAHIQTHSDMPGSWPQGHCSCLAHNSDWLEYQRRELNPKQLLTRDIKQSGESSRGDLMMPPGKHVLAHTVALFNTITSKQLIALSKRPEEGATASPLSSARRHNNPEDRGLVLQHIHVSFFFTPREAEPNTLYVL